MIHFTSNNEQYHWLSDSQLDKFLKLINLTNLLSGLYAIAE